MTWLHKNIDKLILKQNLIDQPKHEGIFSDDEIPF